MALRRRAVLLGVTTLAAGALATAVPAVSAAHPAHKPIVSVTITANLPSAVTGGSTVADTWRSGAFAGFSAIADKDFGIWRGRPITSATDFLTNSSWPAFDNATRLVQTWRGQNAGVLLSISVPLWAGYGYNHLAAAASGYYDKHYIAMAQHLVAAGLGHSVIRLGWEFNGSWFNWGITATGKKAQYATRAREFAQAWRHIVTAIRHVKGAHFTFDWCVAAGRHYKHLSQAYPGDAYVDYIGDDVYDWNRDNKPASAKVRWDRIVHDGAGLEWLAKFARAHHKQISVPEWALVHDAFQRWHSGGDDQSFIDHMHAWFASHNVAYENYFDSVDGTMSFTLNQGKQFPAAGKLYRTLWSRPGGVRHLASG